jgi:hypothetical protein
MDVAIIQNTNSFYRIPPGRFKRKKIKRQKCLPMEWCAQYALSYFWWLIYKEGVIDTDLPLIYKRNHDKG